MTKTTTPTPAEPAQKPAVTVRDIEARLIKFAQRLAHLEDGLSAIALQAVEGTQGEQKAYEDALAEIASLKSAIERLSTAKAAAERRDRAILTEKQKQKRAAHIARVSKIVEQRSPLAAELQAAIETACDRYRKLLALTDKARMAWPGGPAHVPVGCLSTAGIKLSVEHQHFKSGAVIDRGIFKEGPSYPGASVTPGFLNASSTINDVFIGIADWMKKQDEWATRTLAVADFDAQTTSPGPSAPREPPLVGNITVRSGPAVTGPGELAPAIEK